MQTAGLLYQPPWSCHCRSLAEKLGVLSGTGEEHCGVHCKKLGFWQLNRWLSAVVLFLRHVPANAIWCMMVYALSTHILQRRYNTIPQMMHLPTKFMQPMSRCSRMPGSQIIDKQHHLLSSWWTIDSSSPVSFTPAAGCYEASFGKLKAQGLFSSLLSMRSWNLDHTFVQQGIVCQT